MRGLQMELEGSRAVSLYGQSVATSKGLGITAGSHMSRVKLGDKATVLSFMHIVRNRNYELKSVNLGVTQRARFCNLRIQTESQKTNFTKAKTSTDTFNDRKFFFSLRRGQREALLRHYSGICSKHTMFGIRVKVEGISSLTLRGRAVRAPPLLHFIYMTKSFWCKEENFV
jgi:hypothetical protein